MKIVVYKNVSQGCNKIRRSESEEKCVSFLIMLTFYQVLMKKDFEQKRISKYNSDIL